MRLAAYAAGKTNPFLTVVEARPLWALVGIVSTFATYKMTRHLFFNPDVQLERGSRKQMVRTDQAGSKGKAWKDHVAKSYRPKENDVSNVSVFENPFHHSDAGISGAKHLREKLIKSVSKE